MFEPHFFHTCPSRVLSSHLLHAAFPDEQKRGHERSKSALDIFRYFKFCRNANYFPNHSLWLVIDESELFSKQIDLDWMEPRPIAVALQSNAKVWSCLISDIPASNSAEGINVRPLSACRQSVWRAGLSLRGDLPSVCVCVSKCVSPRILNNWAAWATVSLLHHKKMSSK